MENKVIIFDASTIISFAMNGLFEELRKLKESFQGHFIVTQEVKKEIIDKPIKRKRFELEAIRVKQMFFQGVFEMPSVLGISDKEISQRTNKLITLANEIFRGDHKNIKLIDAGEASCVALSQILNKKGIKNVVAIDERTMRMLIENPRNLNKLLQRKLHVKINLNKKTFQEFKGSKVIRSSELVYILYKKNLMEIKDKVLLDALLWAVKFKGCAISEDEIKEINKLK